MKTWPDKPTYLGKFHTRVDGAAKVTGAAKYPSDMQPPGWLYGMIYRSPWPAAQIDAINIEEARRTPGIKAVVLSGDLPRMAFPLSQLVLRPEGGAERSVRLPENLGDLRKGQQE